MNIYLRLTNYWPFTATAAEQRMEGAPVDRKGNALHTVEDFLSGASDYVSLAGDYEGWPYGQKLLIPWGGVTLTGRVVDTGGHFHGAGKVYRDPGYEPIDVCVYSRTNTPPSVKVVGTIVEGDNFDGKQIDYSKFLGQSFDATAPAQEESSSDATSVLESGIDPLILVGLILLGIALGGIA